MGILVALCGSNGVAGSSFRRGPKTWNSSFNALVDSQFTGPCGDPSLGEPARATCWCRFCDAFLTGVDLECTDENAAKTDRFLRQSLSLSYPFLFSRCPPPFSLPTAFLAAHHLSRCPPPFSLPTTFLAAHRLSRCPPPFSLPTAFLAAYRLCRCSPPLSLSSRVSYVKFLTWLCYITPCLTHQRPG
jgi:hypothetical protein